MKEIFLIIVKTLSDGSIEVDKFPMPNQAVCEQHIAVMQPDTKKGVRMGRWSLLGYRDIYMYCENEGGVTTMLG